MNQFQQPAISNPDDKFVAAEHNGQLLLFFPTQLQQAIATAHGTADAVNTKVVNLDTGRVLDNALIFATALVTQLKNAVPDGMVLGRLGQGQNTKGNPPWLLSPHTDADVATAEAYLAANPRNQFGQPQTQQAPPTPPAATPAWGGPAPTVSPAPATGGWGAPVAPAPAPAAGGVDPGLAAAITAKNYPVPATQVAAEQLWAFLSTQG